jgi:hypothetical protein
MANYVIGKIGKSFKFDKSKFKAADGDIDGLNMVLILARHNPDDTFYIIGQNQWDALEIENKPKNVISVFKRDVDKLDKIEEDFYLKRMEGIDVKGGIFIDGISGIRYAQEKYSPHKRMNFAIRYIAPMIRYINDSGIKWTYVQTDPRQKMLTFMRDLFNMPSKVITQTVIKEKTQKIDRNGNPIEIDLDIPYLGAERISAYNFNVNKSFKFGQDELVIILNEGEPCLKRYELIKPYLTDDAIVYGKWKDEIYEKDKRFKGPIHPSELSNILSQVKYTFIVSIRQKWVTFKYLEMIGYGVIPFFHKNYDSLHLLNVPDFLRINDPKELKERIEILENDAELYNKMLRELQEQFFTKEVLDGSLMNEEMIGYLK